MPVRAWTRVDRGSRLQGVSLRLLLQLWLLRRTTRHAFRKALEDSQSHLIYDLPVVKLPLSQVVSLGDFS
jgi:hypothetical protein